MDAHLQRPNQSSGRSPRRGLDVWPIRTNADYDRAVAVVNHLAVYPEGTLSPSDQDRLDIFTELIAAYDDAHFQFGRTRVPPIEMLKSLMEESGMTASDLGRLLGNRQTGHDILTGRRQLSKTHIRKLADHFHLSPEIFL